MKLTQRRIEALECPNGKKDILVFDEEQAGLGCRVTAGGGKSYIAQYRFAGEKRRIPLGSASAVSLATAREAVRTIMGDVAKGRDPAAERREASRQAKEKAEQDKLTLAELVDKWEEGRLAGRRPGYRAEATRALRFAFGRQLRAPAAALDPKTARRIVNEIADAGKAATARLTTAYGRACFAWAVDRDLVADNPFKAIKVEGVASRDRVLTDAELAAVWKATEGPGAYNAIVRLLILTAQRRTEVSGMVRAELAPDFSTWVIPADRAKNGATHRVPLSSQAQDILRAAPRVLTAAGDDTKFVFPGRAGQFAGWSKAKALLDQRSGVVGWRIHDLRRTTATGLQKLGVRLEVTEAVLGHVAGSRAGIVGVYQVHDWADEKRSALNAWGAHIEEIDEGRAQEGNVTPIRARSHAV
jgi:integrase